jgi:dimethylargininase
VSAVEFRGCLHLKSALMLIGEQTLLFNPEFVQPPPGFEMLAVDPDEPDAADVLWLDDVVLIAAEHERTRAILERRYKVDASAMSELLKAEAGMTCCSVIF